MRYLTRGEGEPTRREVEPLGLIFYSDFWHLIGYCRLRRDYRDFRTDRIAELNLCTEICPPHDDFSVRDYVNAWRDKFQNVEIQVKVTNAAAERFRRAWPGGVADEKPVKNGFLMTVLADECDWLVNWLIGFGDAVEILSPKTLRAQLAAKALEIAQHHGADKESDSRLLTGFHKQQNPLHLHAGRRATA